MNKTFVALLATAVLIAAAGRCYAEDPVVALISRIAPGHEKEFIIQTIPTPESGVNVYEVAQRDGRIVLRGDCRSSQCVALNAYLTLIAKVSVSLYAQVPIVVPAKLPLPQETIRKTTRLTKRFFNNYCTFGYSFPWWPWRNWERFIDWMALQGITLPLAQGGSEAIWQKVWAAYGLTDDEIRKDFFTGPAHLPWNRMGNLDAWGGPLPQSYIDGQLALTKRIVARERELGITPILPAFAGHVPHALKRIRPEIKLAPMKWCGETTYFIDPQDPLFHELQVKFLKSQAAELGTDHLYSADPFNEMTPPSWEPAYLASVSDVIFKGMTAADPDAVWVQMAWTFLSRKQWPAPRLEAMIKAVPQGRMLLLDYYCEKVELWRRNNFFGAPFVWNYLGNFGGNMPLCGPVNKVNAAMGKAMKESANLAGIGSTLEGLNNQSMHEFLFARAWEGEKYDADLWFTSQAQAHAGGPDPAAESGFRLFWKQVLGDRVLHGCSDCFSILPTLNGGGRACTAPVISYDAGKCFQAWKEMLAAAPEISRQPGYQLDLVDIGRTALTSLGENTRKQMADAFQRGDAAEFKKLSARFLEIGLDLDRLLGTRPEYLFGYWVAQAWAWGKNAAEADYYERNARNIVTTWKGRNDTLNDYACRSWNGLLKDFYLVRWKRYLDAQQTALDAATGTGKPPEDTHKSLREGFLDHEWAFAQTTGGNYPAQAQGNSCEISRELVAKYSIPGLLGPGTAEKAE